MECPDCRGIGILLGMLPVYAQHVPAEAREPAIEFKCDLCNGAGTVPNYMARRIRKGEQLRKTRLEARYGLRECAELIGVQPSYLSDGQRGKLKIGRIKELRRKVIELTSSPSAEAGQ